METGNGAERNAFIRENKIETFLIVADPNKARVSRGVVPHTVELSLFRGMSMFLDFVGYP